MRSRRFVTLLLVALWVSAGLLTFGCTCCAAMGMTCPSLCASPAQALSPLSYQTALAVHKLYERATRRPATPVALIPTPPPKFLAFSA